MKIAIVTTFNKKLYDYYAHRFMKTYNWPFDFFSMVELIKVEAEIKFAATDEDIDKQLVIKSDKDIVDSGIQATPEESLSSPLLPSGK